MNQFTLLQGESRELEFFPHITAFALTKNTTIQFESFPLVISDDLRVCCIIDGKFEWTINQQSQILYPGDIALVLPGQEIGGSKGFVDIGTLFQLHLRVDRIDTKTGIRLGKWSNLSETERLAIGKILVLNNLSVLKVKEGAELLHEIRNEILHQEIGYFTRVNNLIDSLLIIIARQSTRQADSRRDFSGAFLKLERELRQNLSHQWTVDEMAALFGLGATAFTEKVRRYSGFSPLNYLINIRIAEAVKLLKQPDVNLVDVALDTGFCSSQHFSTTFKKLTGYTPGQFRKQNFSKSK